MKSTKIHLTILSVLLCCGSLGSATLSSSSRILRQSSCQNKFECTNGDCIQKSDVCNGLAQCSDKSDESPLACDCGILETGLSSRSSGNAPGVEDAQLGFHPWLVGVHRIIRNNYLQLMCIGTLIYDDIVLTSANCVFDPESSLSYQPSVIHISSGKLKRDYKVDEQFQQKFTVSEIQILDRYEGDTKGYARNLAIIKLEQKIKRTDFVRPICLWHTKSIPKNIRLGTITGWGLQFVGNYAMNLREATVQLHEIGECVRRFYDPLYKRFLTNDKFCLTFDQGVGLKDIDTGGPVSIMFEGRHFLLGVLSLNRSGTAFGIATAVWKYMPWIQNSTYYLKMGDSCSQTTHFHCGTQCIKKENVCDGRKDCSDGSDEDGASCGLQPEPSESSKSCRIPDSYEIFTLLRCGDSSGCRSKFWAATGSAYNVNCSLGSGFSKPNVKDVEMICYFGKWIPDLNEYKCQSLCPGMDYKSLDLRCSYLGSTVACDKPLIPNTAIQIQCKRSYKKHELIKFVNRTKCRRDGSIEHVLSECTPVCGKPFIQSSQLLISNGFNLTYAKYPWHIAIYWKKLESSHDLVEFEYKCGGTLIDSNKVLTAGHCIWDANINRVVEPKVLAVASGRLHSNWYSKDPLEQKVGVAKVIPHRYYNGAKTKHSHDIAVLILSKDLELSDHTMPACLDLDNIAGGIPKGQKGHILGWGRLNEEDAQPSEILMETWMEYLDLNTCRSTYKKYSFDEYLLSDKFCVIYSDGSGTQAGDSGGGMTFIHESLHYVYGIVSIKKPGQNDFAAFTDVNSHSAMIKSILNGQIDE